MTERSRLAEPEKKPIGGDLMIPLAALAFTLYYFSTIIDSPWTAQVSAFFIGSVLIVLVCGFLVKAAATLARGEATLRPDTLAAPARLVPTRLAFLAITLSYVFLIQWGGFTLTTFVFLCAAMLLLARGRRPGVILLVSAAVSLGGYLLFIAAFDTRFPKGPFERMIEAAF
jgi:hypothetical protein